MMAACSDNRDIDDFMCSTHTQYVVALYCQNCEELICPRCISQGPAGTGLHKEHVYLDLTDAYNQKKAEFSKVFSNFYDASQSKKNERAELNATIQKIKLELLRRKTSVSKELRSLRDTLSRQEQSCLRHLESVVTPAVSRLEGSYIDVDYEVVSREGLIGSAESVQNISEEKCIQFLKGQKRIEGDMVELSSKSTLPSKDPLPELQTLKSISLALNHEKSVLKSAYNFAQCRPSQPQILRSWCSVGEDSASIVFKYSKKTPVQVFIVHYSRLKSPGSTGNNGKCTYEEEKTFKIRRFTGSRVSAVLRQLAPSSVYKISITAVNDAGDSWPAVCYLYMNSCLYSDQNRSKISFTAPITVRRDVCRRMGRACVKLLVCVFILVLLTWATYAMFISWERVNHDLRLYISHCIACICHFLHDHDLSVLQDVYSNICLPVPFSLELSPATWEPGMGGASLDIDVHSNQGSDGDLGDSKQDMVHQIWDWILWFY